MSAETLVQRQQDRRGYLELPSVPPPFEIGNHPLLRGVVQRTDLDLFTKIQTKLIGKLAQTPDTGITGVRINNHTLFSDGTSSAFSELMQFAREKAYANAASDSTFDEIRTMEIIFGTWHAVANGATPPPHERLLRIDRRNRKAIEQSPAGIYARELIDFEAEIKEVIDQLSIGPDEIEDQNYVQYIKRLFSSVDDLWKQKERTPFQEELLFDWKIQYSNAIEGTIRERVKTSVLTPYIKAQTAGTNLLGKLDLKNQERIEAFAASGKPMPRRTRILAERAKYSLLKTASREIDPWLLEKEQEKKTEAENLIDTAIPENKMGIASIIAESYGLSPQALRYISEHPNMTSDLHHALKLGAGMYSVRHLAGWPMVLGYYEIINNSEEVLNLVNNYPAATRVTMIAGLTGLSALRYQANKRTLEKKGFSGSPLAEITYLAKEMETVEKDVEKRKPSTINRAALYSELGETMFWTYGGVSSWPFVYGPSTALFAAFFASVSTSLVIDQAFIRGNVPDFITRKRKSRKVVGATDFEEDHA